MIWTIISSILVFLLSFFAGKKRPVKLEWFSVRKILILAILLTIIFLGFRFLNDVGWFPEMIAAAFMSGFYSSLSGFFVSASFAQFLMKKGQGSILYVNRTFISEFLPNLIALTLIILGIARTFVFTQAPVTPISISSGLSLISIGLYALTLRITPEFRHKGFIILDQKIDWKELISYSWYQDQVIEIEFTLNDEIRIYKTVVPPTDEKEVEALLSKKMREKMEKTDSEE